MEQVMEVESYTDDFLYEGDERILGKNDYCNFIIEGADFFPCKKVSNTLPNGYYTIRKDYTRGIFFRKKEVNLDRLVKLDKYPIYQSILKDIETFWNSKDEYIKRGRVYKRNMLLYSPPGMGKTSLINLLVEDLVENRNGFVISLSDDNDILNFNDAMSYIRAIMPNKPIIVIIEDIDNFIGESADSKLETEILNMLDGINKHSNILTIATTNYPEILTERYLKRPSRFNRKFSFSYPDSDLRREFLVKINLSEDIEKINLDEWVKNTEGWTVDYLKELSDSVFINGYSEEDSFKEINEMIKTNVVRNDKPKNKQSGVGLKIPKGFIAREEDYG